MRISGKAHGRIGSRQSHGRAGESFKAQIRKNIRVPDGFSIGVPGNFPHPPLAEIPRTGEKYLVFRDQYSKIPLIRGSVNHIIGQRAFIGLVAVHSFYQIDAVI